MALLSYPFPKCVHPVHLTNKWSHEQLFVPCGKCWACNMNRGFKYSKLCQYEACTSKVVLVTLTFSNDFIPLASIQHAPTEFDDERYCMFDEETSEFLGEFSYPRDKMLLLLKKCRTYGRIPYLSKFELQLFIKRLRFYLQKYEKAKIRYFACGEYGPEHFRPHFHILFFVEPENEKLFEYSGHQLGEFERFTWSHRKDVVYTNETPLSKLEYYVRKSWSYGSTDFARVSQGDASSYVAGYVNSSCNVPPCFAFQSTKPFCVHSRFLGRKVFGKEFISFCKCTPEEVVQTSLVVAGKYEDSRLPNEVAAAFYPRCKGFSYSTDEQLYYRYMVYPRLLYSDVFRQSKKLTCTDLATYIEKCMYDFLCNGYYRTSFDDVIAYFLDSTDYVSRYEELSDIVISDLESGDFSYRLEKFRSNIKYSVYRELLVSKLFYNNSLKWISYLESTNFAVFSELDFTRLFFKKIKNFWSYIDYCNLSKWYDEQQVYFKLDYADCHDVKYLYNNTEFDEEEFLSIDAYRTYISYADSFAQSSVKHKLQNDKNKLFNY